MSDLGELLNTVLRLSTCPRCGRDQAMAVHEHGVRWACGHTRGLPPLPTNRPQGRRKK